MVNEEFHRFHRKPPAGIPSTRSAWWGLDLVAVCFLAALAIPAGPTTAEQQTTAERVRAGVALLEAGDPIGALEHLGEALAEDPDLWTAHYYRGTAFAQLQRWDEAALAFARSTELRPGFAEGHFRAHVAAINSGNRELAWAHGILAHQSGRDMRSELTAPAARMPPTPDDLEQQLAVARVLVEPEVDISDWDGRDVPSRQPEWQRQITAIMGHFRSAFRASPRFGVVLDEELADYVFVLKLDSLLHPLQVTGPVSAQQFGGVLGNGPAIKGDAQLREPPGQEVVWRRRVQITDVGSRAQVNAEVERIIGYLEAWR